MPRGLFITFEGIDGCGKSTQFNMVSEWLKSIGEDILVVREPGGTEIGERIREILLDKKSTNMSPVTELLLFEAARAQNTSQNIRPAILNGTNVLCDRFYDSTFAYQGYARHLGEQMVVDLNEIATEGLAPDITFLIDIDVEEALKRRMGRDEAEDRMEAQGIQFQRDVREGYLAAAQRDSRIVKIDGKRTPEVIFEEIKGIIESRLKERG